MFTLVNGIILKTQYGWTTHVISNQCQIKDYVREVREDI